MPTCCCATKRGVEADADSVIGLLMLDSAQGKQVEVQVGARGPRRGGGPGRRGGAVHLGLQ